MTLIKNEKRNPYTREEYRDSLPHLKNFLDGKPVGSFHPHIHKMILAACKHNKKVLPAKYRQKAQKYAGSREAILYNKLLGDH